jgi:hypothetical protein
MSVAGPNHYEVNELNFTFQLHYHQIFVLPLLYARTFSDAMAGTRGEPDSDNKSN